MSSQYIGALSLLLIAPLSNKYNIIREKLVIALEKHRAHKVEEKYGIKLAYPPRAFPFDSFYRDYFQVPSFLRNLEVAIDVGTSIGDFSLIAAKAFGARKVIAVEPEPTFYSYLLKNIRLNKPDNVVVPLNVALSDKAGTLTLYYNGTQLSVRGSKARICPSITLDKLIHDLELRRVSLIKIDTEGSEIDILKGARNTINTFRPRLIVEVHSKRDRDAAIKLLRSYNCKEVYEKVKFP